MARQTANERRAKLFEETRRRQAEHTRKVMAAYDRQHAALEKKVGCTLKFTVNLRSAGRAVSGRRQVDFWPAVGRKWVVDLPRGGQKPYPTQMKAMKAACRLVKTKRR